MSRAAGAVDQQLDRRSGFKFVIGKEPDVGERDVAEVYVDLARVVAGGCASPGADGATAEINFGAVYVLNGATTNPGNADGFLPFVMDYQ